MNAAYLDRVAAFPFEAAVPPAPIPFPFPRSYTHRMRMEMSSRFHAASRHPWVDDDVLTFLTSVSSSFREYESGLTALERALTSPSRKAFAEMWNDFVLLRTGPQPTHRRRTNRSKWALLPHLIAAISRILAALLSRH